MLRSESWTVKAYGGATSWRFPQKRLKKGHLWLNDGSCVWLRPEHSNHSGRTTLSEADVIDLLSTGSFCAVCRVTFDRTNGPEIIAKTVRE